MQQISQLAAAFSGSSGQQPNEQQNNNASADISAMLSSLLNSSGGAPQSEPQPDPPSASEPQTPDVGKLMKLCGIISNSAADDKNIALLNALRPLLRAENQVKIDRLVKIFRIMAAYPLIRDSGLLGGDLFG
jgi:hypothetical protein